ncbi:MAG: S-layer homology domain-containing protein, partial [Oscillospiraceae bacterium]|nr:S-layer homology domain-containing protein [Oscillospiraceae bacterium]
MKQRLHFLMALVLALCLTAPALAAGFTDVPDSHWASGYIQRAYEEDWVHGMGSGKYAPAGTLTRAQFLTMVTNAFFSDDLDKVSVPDGSPWYAACWSVAQANGLQTGTSMERLSDLTDSVSRYDMAQVIVNTLSGEGISASDSEARAAQAAIRDWSGVPAGYRDAVSGAYALGILNGRNGSFDGTATMNRAEAATVLCRMDDAISGAQTPDAQTPDTQTPDTQTPDTQKPETQKPDTQTPAQDASTPEELAAEVVRLVNVERAKEGLAP